MSEQADQTRLVHDVLLQSRFSSVCQAKAANGTVLTLWMNMKGCLVTEDYDGRCDVYVPMKRPYSMSIARFAVNGDEGT